jgi:hypothetical protein
MSRSWFFCCSLLLLTGLSFAGGQPSRGVQSETAPAGPQLGPAEELGNDYHWRSFDGTHLPFRGEQEVLDFLKTASVVSMNRIGEGINKTQKVLLEQDGVQMHAAFRFVKQERYDPDQSPFGPPQSHRDNCFFELAAYKMSKLLGLGIVPPTVLREVNGKKGSVQAWVERSMMEKDRRQKHLEPPDEWYWMAQMLTMHLFDNLVGNYDRHQGNLLIDDTWNIWLIDHTQAFRRFNKLHSPDKLLYCDKEVWERLQKLDAKAIKEVFKDVLQKSEIKALLKRRDKIVNRLQHLIDSNGENAVLFSLKG